MTTLTLPLLFLTDSVVLPGMVVPVELDSERQAAIDAARLAARDHQAAEGENGARRPSRVTPPGIRSTWSEGDTTERPARVLIVPRLDGKYGAVGAIAEITQVGRLPTGEPAVALRATGRARIGVGVNGPGAALWVEAEVLDVPAPDDETYELAREFKSILISILTHRNAWQVVDAIQRINDPSELADAAGYASWIENAKKVQLLETPDTKERLRMLVEWARAHLTELEVTEKIREDVRDTMEKSQREYVLRQQLAAIRKELGESDPEGADDYRSRIEAADLPEKVREAALREVDKLERTSEQSPEVGWIRTWLDTILDLPWNVRTHDTTDITKAREVLDADHSGLDDVKERIVEYLAVRSRRISRGLHAVGGRGSGAVLALVGPPGVGKTSLGESVARALGRKFARVALGGVRDEAEIRGHRRTYVGAMPGRIVRAIKEAGSMNPVILLDEVDKVGSDFRGDPAAALLEVLDPAQNHTFRDHYLEVELDLSDVLFLATANMLEAIPPPLLDRMEVIRLDGYTHDEKVAIARDHLFPRQRERHGLRPGEVEITDAAFGEIVDGYTREAGVRNLEREIGKVLRKVATEVAQGAETPIVVDAGDVRRYLKRRRFHDEAADRTSVPGVATGLAVTGVGGDVLFVEATSMPGEPGMTVTGQLGDVMKESAQIALSYVRSRAEELGIDRSQLEGKRFHVHFPAGAIPKDGPSAGITMTTALVSLLRGQLVRSTVAMTGEVTLSGRVLPIGGVKQKVLAAHRAGLREVILPLRNEPDLEDVPEAVRREMTFHPVDDVAQVLELALEPAEPQATAA
ncbi:MAG TPA: endopeptidase La [Actinopolymorphaceae bacterium]